MSRIARNIVITGGTSGIGKACLDYFKSMGDNVVVLARKNPENLSNFFKCDVSNYEEVKEVFNQISNKYIGIDVLINNAGFGVSGAIELVGDQDIKSLFDVNVNGVINCYKCALPFIKKGGIVINISSVCAFFPLPFRGLYCASKSAVNMLSYGMKMECQPFGVRVACVCPGDVKTNFTKSRVKVFNTNERYGDRIENATNKIDGREDKRMPAEKVAKVIYKQSLKNNPKPYVIVGAKYKVLNFAMRFLPLSLLIKFTSKIFGGHKKADKNTK
ncbi:MAG: SDR family NAD(P)-dependent oxidoreductase [Clostridia bacterium]|nr:SDR family NAD(P)-dependent oxidoreductase [Clostridia bacterium]